MDTESFRGRTSNLPVMTLKTAEAYLEAIPALVRKTNELVLSRNDVMEYIGSNTDTTATDNHSNHARFMANVFILGDYDLLTATLPWVYRAYMAHGFSSGYFPLVVKSFMKGVSSFLAPEDAEQVNEVYSWMLEQHGSILALAGSEKPIELPRDPLWLQRKTDFLMALVHGDNGSCLSIARDSVSSFQDLIPFYSKVIQPSMYEIGRLWEIAELSIAQEHLASAIVTRVMGALDGFMADRPPTDQGRRAVVTSAASEYHEIGAWMIADYFESAGWQVRYLGANTPSEDIIDMMEDFNAAILALSVTMPFNLMHARDLIGAVRRNPLLEGVQIIVGGRVFNENPGLWKRIGADAFAEDVTALDKVIGARYA